ncbi:hypothetical protein [Nocardia sp. alder85J]|uniref:DUF7373 family lipoprotein n=1 Tax=Nocardia sp. alder85J TaxID=2862949 RepID=UPI001CD452D8|nr:hypothetical protein [Nocardia sp. alder85J]MCX4097846.1 hypothetical protein [Nocardia sp. alder85J]
MRLTRCTGFLAVVAVVVTGCTTIRGTGTPAEIDVHTLDTGRYSAQPPTMSRIVDRVGYLRIEAARLAGAVLSPYSVDPAYAVGASAEAHTDTSSVTDYLYETTVPALTAHGFLVGFSTGSADSVMPLTKAVHGTREREGLTVTVLRFPGPEDAAAAAHDMDAADFAANPENTAVQLPDYPDAAAHWRPSVPTLGTTLAHDAFVIAILADARTTDLDRLVQTTQRYLRAELPELDHFEPTPPDQLSTLQQDPDHVLIRTLHASPHIPAPDGQGELVFTLPGYSNYVLDQGSRLPVLQRAVVDRVAVTPAALVFRTRDAAAAQQFVRDSAELGDPVNHRPVDPPDKVPGAVCRRDLDVVPAGEFRCFVSYGRYAALLLGQRLWETQQRAAAQYALLANSS